MAKRTQHVQKSTGRSKTKMKVYNSREAKKILHRNGWIYARTSGDHAIYKKGNKTIWIAEDLNRMIWQRLVKENDINLFL